VPDPRPQTAGRILLRNGASASGELLQSANVGYPGLEADVRSGLIVDSGREIDRCLLATVEDSARSHHGEARRLAVAGETPALLAYDA